MLWAAVVDETMVEKGKFEKVDAVPNMFCSGEEDQYEQIDLVYHGDDFLAGGEPERLDWMDGFMEKNFKLGKAIRIGPGALPEGVVLNRTIRWDLRGFQVEPNQKHVEDMIDELGLRGAKGSAVPGSKSVGAGVAEIH